jgi:type II secretory pathway pseudopilin PulG
MRMRYLLLCVVIGATAGAVMVATRHGPGIQHRVSSATPQSRNDQRADLLKQLAQALTQYKQDHGKLPVTLSSAATQICTSSGSFCAQVHLVDLSFLTTGGSYVPTLPEDPLGGQSTRGTGFFIAKLSDGTIQLTAPEAELGKTIKVTFSP